VNNFVATPKMARFNGSPLLLPSMLVAFHPAVLALADRLNQNCHRMTTIHRDGK
jgi:hypothetical protein